MKKISFYIMALFACLGVFLNSCQDENTLSRAVLASADQLNFEAQSAGVKIIRITSDADWVVDAPEWVTVSPSKGQAGQTEVEISVSDNMRGGAPDNPRKATVIFKGRNSWSEAPVVVRQDGDKFRDLKGSSIDDLESAPEETTLRIENATVVCLTANGFVATDGNKYFYTKQPAMMPAVGDKVIVEGDKYKETTGLSYISGVHVIADGAGTIPTAEPTDITAGLDKVNFTSRNYVKVSGAYDGSSLKVNGAACQVYFEDPAEALKVSEYTGHKIAIIGYFAGMASPVVKIIPSEIQDLGINETVYFSENFEWLEPWCAVGDGKTPADDIVGTDQGATGQPQISKSIVDGVTAEKALLVKGYEFMRYDKNGPNAGECIYLQKNYLKFGKTGFQGSMTLPAMESLGDGVEGATLAFDWYSQRQGSGVFDPTEIVVIVNEGGVETQFAVPALNFESGAVAKWTRAKIKLDGVKLTKNTRITIRNVDSQLTSAKALRWHIDNIILSKAN